MSVYLYVLPTGGAGIGVVVVTVLKLGGNVNISFSKGGLSFAGWNSPYVFLYMPLDCLLYVHLPLIKC